MEVAHGGAVEKKIVIDTWLVFVQEKNMIKLYDCKKRTSVLSSIFLLFVIIVGN